MKKFLLVFLSLVFASCLPTKQFVKFADDGITDSLMAKIYVLRPSYLGSLMPMKVYCNDKYIGVTGPHGYLCWSVNIGDYTIMSTSENKAYLNIKTKPGKEYYIKQKPKLGFFLYRVGLEELHEVNGKITLLNLDKPKLKY